VHDLSSDQVQTLGAEMHEMMTRLFPICRSLTGNGVRETFAILQDVIGLDVHEVPSGTKCFDWTVPDEWNIKDAYVKTPDGRRVIDFQESNLHVMGYSTPIDAEMSLEDLRPHLYADPSLPHAIPYLTSYYQRRWGFCLSQEALDAMPPGPYEVKIDSSLEPGSLTYAETLIPGDSEEEILLSTNVCHPSLANNELSGPVLTAFLARHIARLPRRRYSYRIVFVPETIGMLAYLDRNLDAMRSKVVGGYHVVCVGGPGDFTYIQSRNADCLTDKVTAHILKHACDNASIDSYSLRGSDERQLCAPGIDLPIGTLTKTKFENYPEYHTSLDDLDYVRPEHMGTAFDVYCQCLGLLEQNHHYKVTQLGEPNLGSRGLWPTIGGQAYRQELVHQLLALLAYADGENDLIDIAERHDMQASVLYPVAETLHEKGLLEK